MQLRPLIPCTFPIQELLHLPILRLYFSWKKPVKSTVLERRHKKTALTSTKSSLNRPMLASLHPSETPQLLPRRTLLPHLRQAISTKCQLLCSMFRTNMVSIEPTSSPACPCLTANETVNHLTGACPLYKDKREAFIKSLSTCTQHQLHVQSIPPHLVADFTTNPILLGVNGDPPITAQALDHHAASTTVCLTKVPIVMTSCLVQQCVHASCAAAVQSYSSSQGRLAISMICYRIIIKFFLPNSLKEHDIIALFISFSTH